MPPGIAKQTAGLDRRTVEKREAVLRALKTGGKLVTELADALPADVGTGARDPQKTRQTVARKVADALRDEGLVKLLGGGHYRLANP